MWQGKACILGKTNFICNLVIHKDDSRQSSPCVHSLPLRNTEWSSKRMLSSSTSPYLLFLETIPSIFLFVAMAREARRTVLLASSCCSRCSFSFPAWCICKAGGAGRGIPLLCWHLNRTDGCILLQEFCASEGIPSDEYFLRLSSCAVSLCAGINCLEDHCCVCAF